jgi:hypothetical protein
MTLLMLLARLRVPLRRIVVGSVIDRRPRRVVLQEYGLLPWATISGVALGCLLHGPTAGTRRGHGPIQALVRWRERLRSRPCAISFRRVFGRASGARPYARWCSPICC